MSEEKKPFTVTDRRHFTREGEVRGDDPLAAATESKPVEPAQPKASRAAEPPRPSAEHTPAPGPSARPESPERRTSILEGGEPDEPGGLDFVGLLLSLGTQASMMLGLTGSPGERPAPPDLAGARSIISLLEVLADKTEGRRTAEEDEVLEGLLYELRMQYVALARKGGP